MLAQQIEAIPDDKGCSIETKALKPQDLYRQVKGVAPDLLVYFGQLAWRSVGTVGSGAVQTFENDTGPDDANHAEEGIFILPGPGIPANRQWHEGQLMDLAATLLRPLHQSGPSDMQGKAFPVADLGEAR